MACPSKWVSLSKGLLKVARGMEHLHGRPSLSLDNEKFFDMPCQTDAYMLQPDCPRFYDENESKYVDIVMVVGCVASGRRW